MKDSIVQGFQWGTREGPLCDERKNLEADFDILKEKNLINSLFSNKKCEI